MQFSKYSKWKYFGLNIGQDTLLLLKITSYFNGLIEALKAYRKNAVLNACFAHTDLITFFSIFNRTKRKTKTYLQNTQN